MRALFGFFGIFPQQVNLLYNDRLTKNLPIWRLLAGELQERMKILWVYWHSVVVQDSGIKGICGYWTDFYELNICDSSALCYICNAKRRLVLSFFLTPDLPALPSLESMISLDVGVD